MTTLLSYLRITLFLGGVLFGVQVPMFVAQYGMVLEARLLESQRSLAAFEDEARRYFDGDMARLIAHYHQSEDAVFVEGGDSILAIYRRHQQLLRHFARYADGPWQAYAETFITAESEIRSEVASNFSYAIKLDPAAIGFGLLCGFALSLFGESLVRAAAAVLRPRRRDPRASR